MNWRYHQRTPLAVIWAELYARRPDRNPDWSRCSGLVLCDLCGREYYDHPRHLQDEYLTVVCSGELVKL